MFNMFWNLVIERHILEIINIIMHLIIMLFLLFYCNDEGVADLKYKSDTQLINYLFHDWK